MSPHAVVQRIFRPRGESGRVGSVLAWRPDGSLPNQRVELALALSELRGCQGARCVIDGLDRWRKAAK